MPALYITFTDTEYQALRAAAERENVSPCNFVHAAAIAAVDTRKRVRAENLADINTKSVELHRRLT